MQTSRLYSKTSTFFSFTKQENLISQLEKRFYNIILRQAKSAKHVEKTISNLKLLEADIKKTLINHYFADELLEYLFNLSNFIEHYITYIQEKKSHKLLNIF